MKNKTIIILLIVLALTITACTKKEDKKEQTPKETISKGNTTINLQTYNKIQVGATYEEVIETIGGECNKSSDTTYICSGEIAGTSATLTFENNKLKSKTQKGLE